MDSRERECKQSDDVKYLFCHSSFSALIGRLDTGCKIANYLKIVLREVILSMIKIVFFCSSYEFGGERIVHCCTVHYLPLSGWLLQKISVRNPNTNIIKWIYLEWAGVKWAQVFGALASLELDVIGCTGGFFREVFDQSENKTFWHSDLHT